MSDSIICNVLSGDNITDKIINITKDISLGKYIILIGFGLIQQDNNIIAINSGKLQYIKPNKFRIICPYKRV